MEPVQIPKALAMRQTADFRALRALMKFPALKFSLERKNRVKREGKKVTKLCVRQEHPTV